MKNDTVAFPEGFDTRSFFSDTSLDQAENLTAHHDLVSAKQFRLASKLADNCGQDYYGAYLFNAIEQRLKAIGEFELSRNKNMTKIRPVYQEEMPDNVFVGITWFSSVDLDGIYIKGDPPRSLFLSIDKPAIGTLKKNDIWLNIDQPDVFVDREDTKKYYQKDKPEDAKQFNVWLSEAELK